MSFLLWFARCLPAFSVLAVLGLSYSALVVEPYGSRTNGRHEGQVNISQHLFAGFIVVFHVLAACFPIRLCFALYDLLQNLRVASHDLMYNDRKYNPVQDVDTKMESPLMIHAIIVPNYREDVETLTDTLSVLSRHPMAATNYDIYLAMEMDEFNATNKAQSLMTLFTGRFRRFTYTRHPSGLQGEIKGRSSIVGWAAQEAMRFSHTNLPSAEVLVTIMDANIHLLPTYFETISEMNEDDPVNAASTIYVPPIAVEHNSHNTPRLARLSDVLRTCAALSGQHSRSTVSIPTSVYTLPMSLVEYVDGWDTGAESIEESAHMYLKCSLALTGNLKTKIVYSPAVHCEGDTGAIGFRASTAARAARFNQGLRRSWGALDVAYTIRNFFHRKPAARKLSPCVSLSLIVVLKRLVEAHFMLVNFFSCFVVSCVYTWYTPRGLVPAVLGNALTICDWIRFGYWVAMLVALALYRRYHETCLHMRQVFLYRSNLLEDFTARRVISDTVVSIDRVTEALLFPVAAVLFDVLPAFVAIFSHLGTTKLLDSVSLGRRLAIEERNHDMLQV